MTLYVHTFKTVPTLILAAAAQMELIQTNAMQKPEHENVYVHFSAAIFKRNVSHVALNDKQLASLINTSFKEA